MINNEDISKLFRSDKFRRQLRKFLNENIVVQKTKKNNKVNIDVDFEKPDFESSDFYEVRYWKDD